MSTGREKKGVGRISSDSNFAKKYRMNLKSANVNFRHGPHSEKKKKTNTHVRARAHTHTHTLARTHASTHARTQARTHARTHARKRAHTRTHIHTHAHARARTHLRTHVRTHTRTPTPAPEPHTHCCTRQPTEWKGLHPSFGRVWAFYAISRRKQFLFTIIKGLVVESNFYSQL